MFSKKLILLQLAMLLGQKVYDFSTDLFGSLYNLLLRSRVFPAFDIANQEFASESDRIFERRSDQPLPPTSGYRLVIVNDFFSITEIRVLSKLFGLTLADERCLENLPEVIPEEILEECDSIAILGVDVLINEVVGLASFPIVSIREIVKDSDDIFFRQKIEFRDVREGIPSKTAIVFQDKNFENFLTKRKMFQKFFGKYRFFLPKLV